MPEPTPPKLPPDLQKRSDIATVQEAEAKARSAIADASNAEQTAALNRVKGAIGEPAAGPFTGDVALADGAALAEANFLARSQLAEVAAATAKKVVAAIGGRKVVYLTTSDGPPDLSHDAALSSRIALVEKAASDAKSLSDAALGTGADARMLIAAPLAAAGLALSGASALLDYFKTDFKIGGDTVTSSDRDLQLLVGDALLKNSIAIFVDGFPPTPGKTLSDAVQSDLLRLSSTIATLRGRIAAHDALVAAPDQGAAQPADAAGANDDQESGQAADVDTPPERTAQATAEAACTAAVSSFDALMTSLDADVGGVPFLVRALRERRLRELLSGNAAIVSLKVDGSWATHVVRKNFFSGLFGKLPVRVSATVGASWGAYDFDAGSLFGGGIETARSALTDILDVKTT